MLQHIRAVPWTAMLDIGSFLHSYLLPLRSLFIWAKSDTSGAHWSTADAVNRCPPCVNIQHTTYNIQHTTYTHTHAHNTFHNSTHSKLNITQDMKYTNTNVTHMHNFHTTLLHTCAQCVPIGKNACCHATCNKRQN